MPSNFDVSKIYQHDNHTPRVNLLDFKNDLTKLPSKMIIRLSDIRDLRNTDYLSWMDGTQISNHCTLIDRTSLIRLIENPKHQPHIPVEEDEVEEDKDGPGWIYAYTYSPQVQIVGEPTYFLFFQTGTDFNRPMAIKIGRTKNCPLQRIAHQIRASRVALPNSPVPVLLAWTPGRHKVLERKIHGQFRSEGKKKAGAPGAEWFDVKPSDVVRLITSLVEQSSERSTVKNI
jgi:Meiotically up-regulated gene 113